ncbi:MAG: glycoside hydrolase family 78 protein [Bacteroidales bacterium]|jgi:alpha-L-rhamnosidase|nr:glycoside hydrolase family 78 protein [Bacteroidales bacterium]
MLRKLKKIISIASLAFLPASYLAAFEPSNLRCEYLSRPLGIDVPAPRLTWILDDARYGALQTAYRLVVGTDSAAVAAGRGDAWDTRKTASCDMLAVYSGNPLESFTKYYWCVRIWDKDGTESVPVVSSFETGMMAFGKWKGTWISDGYSPGQGNSKDVKPAPYFRKEFTAAKKIKSARAYIAVAGLYELYINGERIGDHRLDPAVTKFDRRTLYVVYDVTQALQNGKNAIGVLLGNGWYNHQSITIWYYHLVPWRDRPAFCMDLRITYEDGTVETIASNQSWKTSLSPLVFNNIFTGEHYDARLEQPGWNTVGFDDSQWKGIFIRTAPSQRIISQQFHPIRNTEKIPVATMKKVDDLTYLFDLGRNIAGVSELRVQGAAGTEIRLLHGETLGDDGLPNMEHLSGFHRPEDDSDPFGTDIFTLSGKGEESFMSRFNYKGFQYVKVTASEPITLTEESLTGWFMHTDLPAVGNIETSNPLINKIWWATNNSYRSNMHGYPTDCPHREKNGWTDAHLIVETGLYNFDGITIYEKWLADHRDEQQPNGLFPSKIPSSGDGYTWANGIDWTSSIAVVPWNIYLFYGDSRLLIASYEHIKRLVDRVTDSSPDGLTSWGLGDWVPYNSKASVELTSSIYYYADAQILTKTACLLGNKKEENKYAALSAKIKDAINDKYLDREAGTYREGFQTGLSMALFWGVVPDDMKTKVASTLAAMVKKSDYHLDVGELGSKTLLNALSENGYGDIAYRVASQKTVPSWGYWLVNGATTLYEDWTNAAVNGHAGSLNHVLFGEIGAWFYKALGGIHPDPEKPGFKNILLQPNFVAGLNYSKTSYDSPRGLIVSNWERKGSTVIYQVTVPANATATLTLSGKMQIKKAEVNDNGKITLTKTDNGYHLPAGQYVFTIGQ